ncbi:hypothetical protein [Paenibacillus urinalis]|uniref:hypothetical protein n=1 Tax=Paenibacillus urinalis TaxID=521520 RepID=UPI001960F77D
MIIEPGHGLLLSSRFTDGQECPRPRTFLVIENTGTLITALNISSSKGKEAKIAFMDSNKLIKIHYPPFNQPSFVKLDAIYYFEAFDNLERALLCNRQKLNSTELGKVLNWHSSYKSDYPKKMTEIKMTKQDLVERNPKFITVKHLP